MAEYQKIEYLIGKDGKISETVLNGQGESCTLATAELEAALGNIEARKLLPEYDGGTGNYLVAEQTQTQSLQHG
jgi:hypothetical protein